MERRHCCNSIENSSPCLAEAERSTYSRLGSSRARFVGFGEKREKSQARRRLRAESEGTPGGYSVVRPVTGACTE